MHRIIQYQETHTKCVSLSEQLYTELAELKKLRASIFVDGVLEVLYDPKVNEEATKGKLTSLNSVPKYDLEVIPLLVEYALKNEDDKEDATINQEEVLRNVINELCILHNEISEDINIRMDDYPK